MRHERNFWVIGGDMRLAKLAELLSEDGHTVHTFGLDRTLEPILATAENGLSGIHLADCVILPLPAIGEGGYINAPFSSTAIPLATLLGHLRPGQVVCAGKVDDDLSRLAQLHDLALWDYFTREELAVANAVPTAEGAVQIALEEMPITLHGARALVLGYGRLGKLCAHRFQAMGAKVSVGARKWEDLAWAQAYGYETERIDQIDGWLCTFDLVVNTVPARILDGPRLSDLHENCLVIDLASKPGGVDMEKAARLGVKVVWALSLPGKVAPVTSGKIIRDTVYNILRE